MSTQTIEQIERIDKRRYRLNLLRAIALVTFIGGLLAQNLVPDSTDFWDNFIQAVYGFGCGLTCAAGGALLVVTGKIRRDYELNQALNNEMFRHYTMRSKQCGFIAMLAASGVLLGVEWLGEADIPGAVCCLAILFAGMVAQAVALLVYDRTR